MFGQYGYGSSARGGEQCASYPATPPRPDDKRYPAPEAKNAQSDGFTIVSRQPVGADPCSGWMPNDQADEYERRRSEYGGPSQDGNVYGTTGGFGYSDY